MNKPLITILITVALDIIGLGFVLPFLPFIVESFGKGEEFVGITFGVFSLGMLLGGIVLGKLSDIYGRKNALKISVGLNLLGYLLFAFSPNIWVFIIARLFSGLGGAGWAIGSAYISDISDETNRTKNLGLIGATFGIGFVIGPLFGALINTTNLLILGLVPAFVIFLNLLMIFFLLPETNKHLEDTESEKTGFLTFSHNKGQIYTLFVITFIIGLGMAGLQATFGLLLKDRFGFGEQLVGYLFVYIGLSLIAYQTLGIKHVRKWLNEKQMIVLGISSLVISFILFGVNNYAWATLLIVPLNTFGMGNIQPAVASLLAKKAAGHEVGKAMGTNASSMSLGNIIGAVGAGYLYTVWSGTPYIVASLMFVGIWFIGMFLID